MSLDMDFDLGPLTWVKGELDSALAAARAAIGDWNEADLNPLKAAAAHLHQVYGALNIVDLKGVSLLTVEAERLLADMEAKAELRTRASADVVVSAIDALTGYLDELMAGAPHAELRLAPIYEAVVAQRGGEAPAPSELFFPDTDIRAPKRVVELPLDDAARARAIHEARSRYQRGLLQVLQNKEPMLGLAHMDQAVREVERLAPGAVQYSFWWSVTGLMEILRRGTLPTDFWVKRLCGRIDMQMRRLMEGSSQLADRLFRDVLFFVAQDTAPNGRTQDIQDLFQLRNFFPAAAEDGVAAAQLPHIANLKDQLAVAKDQWMRYCSGRGDSLEPFQHAVLAAFEAATRLPNAAMLALTRIIQAVAKRLPGGVDTAQNEALQLEMATALLLSHNAADHYEALGEAFTRQSEVQAMRLQAAVDPSFDASRIPEVDLLDEISRAAQEKLVVAQVAQEIQANLNQVEEILDRFFRNAEERGSLPLVPGLMKQSLGALDILELEVAANLVKEAMTRIGHFAETDAQLVAENLDWVADALSSLGQYVEALRYGRDDPRALSKLLEQPEVEPPREVSVETNMREEAERIRAAVEQWNRAGRDESGKAALKAELSKLGRDADLVGDADLRGRTDAAMKALDSASPELAQASLDNLAPHAASASSAESVQLAGQSDADIDQEILGTYIEEANEVLGSIAVQVSRLHVSPYDTEAFATIRRGFHTLKGSGRMVGLTELADLAWEVEQTLNQWLRDERAPTPEMLGFLEDAGNAFLVWVETLQEQGVVRAEAGPLISMAQRLRGEGGGAEASPPKPEAGVPAESARGAGDAASHSEEENVDVEGHVLPAELLRIFSEEAGQRLTDMDRALVELARSPQPAAWEAFIRAAHTLAGISRTTGFTPLAEAAHAVELWGGQWPEKMQALPGAVADGLDDVVGLLADALKGILELRFPHDLDPVQDILAGLNADDAPPASEAAELIEQAGMVESVTQTEAAESEAALEPEPELAMEDEKPAPAPALAPAPAPAPVEVISARDDLDAQLLPIFLEEAAELLPRVGEALRVWRGNGDDQAAQDALKRTLHTLKGSARMAGAMILGERVHALETRVIDAGDASAQAAFFDQLEADYDRIADVVDHLKAGESGYGGTAPVAAEETAAAPSDDAAGGREEAAPAGVPATATVDDATRVRQSVRFKSDILDTLLNEAGEVSIARARIETVLANYKQTALELTGNVQRLRSQLRELEIQAEAQMSSRLSQVDESHFDPLEFDRFSRLQELTRQLAESVNDVSMAQESMLSGLDEADHALIQQGRMARSLQQELMHIRMVPLNTLAERLYRVVRQAAKETDRKAQLELDGGQTELDRGVLDKIAAPLEHLVRNAVAHGLEASSERIAAGKDEYGEIRLSARQEGNEIVLVLEDDGAGVDFAAVRARALALGWIKPDQEVTREQMEQFLFRSGFSTASEVTELAGRGIGLDVVKSDIAGIGGRVRLDSESGKGTRFTIRLPLTLALTQVVLARAGDQTWALPASLVTLVREVRVEQLPALHEAGQVEHEGEAYPLRTLAELVGRKAQTSEGRFRTILLLRAGAQRLALRVDALEGNVEAVVKNIGPQLARIAGISGATVLGDGRVALILNPFQLAERAPQLPVEEEAEEVEQGALVMVVDDSLTVRKIASRFLQREGFRVTTAKDGVEALELLEEELPAVMLLDIEMPRMDGFEVTQHVRGNSRTRHLPIIMITSRTAEKHRAHALELGVDAYMGKPYQEEELLEEISRLAGVGVASGA